METARVAVIDPTGATVLEDAADIEPYDDEAIETVAAPQSLWKRDWRQYFFPTWTAVGVAVLLWMLGTVLHTLTTVLLLFIVAALVAFIIQPLVSLAEERLHLSRTWAALVVFLVLALLLLSLAAGAALLMMNQVTAAINQIPEYYQNIQNHIPDLEAKLAAIGIHVNIRDLQKQALASLPTANVAAQGLAWLGTFTDAMMNITVVLFLAFYLIIDGERLTEVVLKVAPVKWKPYVLFVQKTLTKVVGGYLRGQLTMAVLISVGVFIASLLLGIQFSLVLGVLGFVFEMVPMIGPMLIGAAMVAMALLDSWQLAALALVVYFLLQFLESNILGPRITGHAVGLHPIAAALGLIAGAHLFGLWGALLAMPVLGFTFVTIAAVYHQVTGRSPEDVVIQRKPMVTWQGRPRRLWGRLRSVIVVRPRSSRRAQRAVTVHPTRVMEQVETTEPSEQTVPPTPPTPPTPRPGGAEREERAA